MKYQFAICDDEDAAASHIQSLASLWARRSGVSLETERFPSAEAFLFRYEEKSDFDLLLLDIEMTGMDGVSLAKRIRRNNEDIQIVFITGYTDYIAEGYEVSALHYLVKPVDEDKFFEVLTRAVSRLKRNEPLLTLELPEETVCLPFREIRWIEVSHNYATVHARRDYNVKRSLGELEKVLDGRFFRVGRSFILNLAFVRRVARTEAELVTGERIPLPRRQYDKLNQTIISRM